MNGFFDGDFRRKPIVSIGGASRKLNKDELLAKAQKEREQRQAVRLQNASALKIQCCFRSFSARKKAKDEMRQRFDILKNAYKNNDQQRCELVSHLLFFYDLNQDGPRLVWICQMIVKERKDISTQSWLFKLARLANLCVKFISLQKQENVAPLLRFIEIFTSPKNYQDSQWLLQLFDYLVRQDFFAHLRRICDAKIPPMLAETTKAPTPIAETLFNLIMQPLRLIHDDDNDFGKKVLLNLTKNFLTNQFSEQVDYFIVPSLAREKSFPYGLWSKILYQCSRTFDGNDHGLDIQTPWLLYSFLKIGKIHLGNVENFDVQNYLNVLSDLTGSIMSKQHISGLTSTDHSDSDIEEDEMDMETNENMESQTIAKSIAMLNDEEVVASLVSATEKSQNEPLALTALCKLCHNLLLSDPSALHHFRLLYTLAFRPVLLHRLWNLILDTKRPSLVGSSIPLLTVIARGIRLSVNERDAIVPLLAVFAAVFCYLLVTIHDTEFYGDEVASGANAKIWMPFTLSELVPMSLSLRDVTLGLIELAFPQSRPAVREEYQQAVKSVRNIDDHLDAINNTDTQIWSHLFKITVNLVRQLYTRDTRRQFCPENHWINDRITLPLDRPHDISFRRSRLRQYRPFQGLRVFTREELVEEGPPLSTKEVRLATVLREMPYAISFSQRVHVFHNLVARDKEDHQGDRVHFLQGKAIRIHVRRNFIYEDAFDSLSPDNEPNMRLKMRVVLMNTTGLQEAGIDGGGLFREFTNEVLKAAFDPNRGFFKLTRDQNLYPNPNVDQLHENYIPHYYFIGRMLGKALYENMLVELPLASFFLSKLLGQKSANVDIDHLQSLDPELYKNLLYLKNYDDDVQDLGLDFTIVSEEIGQAHVEEMKPGGANIPVTNENRIEYIHLVADFKLNRQIRSQCAAFRQGLSDVIELDWLRMFSYRELQTLISGADHEINIDDLQQNTKYGNGFTETHETITSFWTVVKAFSEEQKRKLLKFVTSCSRPPLLGFKELDPPFCIQNVGAELDRLPTASTCMNLLKLPDFKDEKTLRTKLLYAVESDSGFELS